MSYRTVVLDSNAMKREGKASGAITPGHLLERTSTADTFKVHATAGGFAEPMFAFEDELQGEEIGDAYSDADRMFYYHLNKGDRAVGRIANGEDISRGDELVSNGDGTLKKATPDSSAVVVEEHTIAIADEDNDMSSSSGVDDPLCAIVIQ